MSPSLPTTAARRPLVWMPYLLGAGLVASLVFVFFVAPTELKMGEVQRIFYFHVASATAALVGFIGCALASLAYLVLRMMRGYEVLARVADRLAVSFGEVGVLFGLIVLITGPLWAKPAWNTFWTWEPRLVLMLLTVFLFVGYLVLRGYAKTDDLGKRLAAGIAVIGGPAVYLIHVAVEMWGGNHPQVMTGQGGGLEPGPMRTTFALSLASLCLFAGYLVWQRYQHHRLVEQVDDAYLTLSDLEEQP
ncbi:MAG: cytochrome c biogenesis protein CcsA [Myxococcales bacterium]|nr:cytochrome c biogenesis protein CcsA [Myxococcales bacterium]MCB9736648.1 cytochrome c biogenesis protein CcsA [Deltaproteobacteria bacterium]